MLEVEPAAPRCAARPGGREARVRVRVRNPAAAAAEAAVRPGAGCAGRWRVQPERIRLGPGQACDVELVLRLPANLAPAVRKRAQSEAGQRDAFQIRSAHFEQRFHVTFHLEEAEGGGPSSKGAGAGAGAGAATAEAGPSSSRAGAVGAVRGGAARGMKTPKAVAAAAAAAELDLLRGSVEAKDAQLQDKDEIIRALYSRPQVSLSRARAEEVEAGSAREESSGAGADSSLLSSGSGSSGSGSAGGGGQQMAQLMGANAALRSRNQALEMEAIDLRAELMSLEKVKSILEAGEPDVAALVSAALEQERGSQEARNEKVLRMMAHKDQQIRGLQGELEAAIGQVHELEVELLEAQSRLDLSESRLVEELEAKINVVGECDAARKRAREAQSQIEGLAEKVALSDSEAESVRQDRAKNEEAQRRLLLAEEAMALKEKKMRERTAVAVREEMKAEMETLRKEAHAAAVEATNVQSEQRETIKSLQERLGSLQASLNAREDAGGALSGAGGSNQTTSLNLALQEKKHELEAAQKAQQDSDRELESRMSKIHELQKELRREKGPSGVGTENERLKGEVEILSTALQKKDASLQQTRSRLAKLEEVHRSAQVTALRTERTLQNVRDQTKEVRSQDAQNAQAAAARLTVRVSTLAASERKLKEELGGARRQLKTQDREIRGLQQHVADLQSEQNQRVSTSVAHKEGVAPRPPPPFQQAAEDAELTIGTLQAQIMTLSVSKNEAEQRMREAEVGQAEVVRRLEQQVRMARADGSARLKNMEETVKILSSKGGLHASAGALSVEVSSLRRTKLRLEEELHLASERSTDLANSLQVCQRDLAKLRGVVDASVSRPIDLNMESIAAKLAAKLESAQEEIDHLRELGAGGDASGGAHRAETSGQASSVPLMAESADVVGDLHETNMKLDVEVKRLNICLEEAQKSVEHCQSAIEAKNRQIRRQEEIISQKNLELAAAHTAEAAAVSRKMVEMERKLQKETALRAAAEGESKAHALETTHFRSLFQSLEEQHRGDTATLTARIKELETSQVQISQSHTQALQKCKEQAIELKTAHTALETLQEGSMTDLQNSVVTLTSQLSMCKAIELNQRHRIETCLKDRDNLVRNLRNAAEELREAQRSTQDAMVECAQVRTAADISSGEVKALRAELAARGDESISAAREIDSARAAAVVHEQDAKALQAAIESQREAHFQKLCAERSQASVAIRNAHSESVRAMSGAAFPVHEKIGAQVLSALDRMLSCLADTDSESCWQQSAVDGLKEVTLDALRAHYRESRVVKQQEFDIEVLRSNLRMAEEKLDESQTELFKALTKLRHQESLVLQGTSTKALFVEERMMMQSENIQAVSSQLEDANGRLVSCQAREDLLQRKVQAMEAENSCLRRKLEILEADESLLEQDRNLIQDMERQIIGMQNEVFAYFDSKISLWDDQNASKDKLVALSGEVCRLKVSESALSLQMSAAHTRCDAAIKTIGTLKIVVRDLENKLEKMSKSAVHDSAVEPLSIKLHGENSKLQNTIFAYKEEVLKYRQALSAKDLELWDAQTLQTEAENNVLAVSDTSRAALQRLREEMTAAHALEIQKLEEEVKSSRSEATEAVHAVRSAADLEMNRADQEAEAAMELLRAQASQEIENMKQQVPEPLYLENLQASLRHSETECTRLKSDNERLQLVVEDQEEELLDLHGQYEIQTETLQEIEMLLQRLEAKAESTSSQGGARRVSSQQHNIAALSRQLVQAKLSQAELQKKLRRGAKEEAQMKRQITERDERIQDLKKELKVKNKAAVTLRKQASTAKKEAAPSCAAKGKTATPREARAARALKRRDSSSSSGIDPIEDEISSKATEIELLESKLTEALLQERDYEGRGEKLESLEKLCAQQRSTLIDQGNYADSAQQEIATSLAIIRGLIGVTKSSSSSDTANLVSNVEQLVKEYRRKNTELKKANAAAKEAQSRLSAIIEEQKTSPLDLSQRAVIRDLTLRCNDLTHDRSKWKKEAQRLMERLRALRSTLGSSEPTSKKVSVPAVAPAVSLEDSDGGIAPPRHLDGAPIALGESQALCALVEQHLESLAGIHSAVRDGVGSLASNVELLKATPAYAVGTHLSPSLDEAESLLQNLSVHEGNFCAAIEAACATMRVLRNGLDEAIMQDESRVVTADPPAPEASLGLPLGSRQDSKAGGVSQYDMHRRQRIKTLREENVALQDQVTKVTEGADLAHEQVRVLSAEKIRLAEENEGLEKQAMALRESYEAVQRTLSETASNDVMIAKTAEAEARMKLVEKEMATERSASTARNNSLKEEILHLTRLLDTEREDRAKIVTTLRSTIQELRNQSQNEAQQEVEFKVMQSQVDESEINLRLLEETNKSLKAELREFKVKAEAAKIDYEHRLQLLQQKNQDLHGHFSDTRVLYESLARRLSSAEEELKSHERTSDQRLSTCMESLTRAKARVDEGLSTCGEKALDVEKMMLQFSTSMTTVEKLQHEVKQTKWGQMMKSMHFSAALNSMRLDAHAAQDEAKRRERELLVELETLSVKLRASEEEKSASQDRSKKSMKSLEEMKSFSEMERKAMHDRHSALLDDIQKKHSRERKSMQTQLEAAVQTAVATAGQKFKAATAEKVARLEKRTASAEARLADSSKRNKELTRQGEAEIARVLQEFSKYKSLKEKEVRGLEEKIGKAAEAKVRSKIYGGRGGRKSASAKEPAPWESEAGEEYRAHASSAITTIQDALGSDKVASMQREVAMAQRKLKLAEKTMEELKQKLQKSRTKVEYLQGRLTAAERAKESDARPSADAFEELQTQLKAAKEAAKAANYESARRLREIKALKGSDSASREDSKRAVAEQAEARAAAEQKLQQASYAIDRKDVLIRDMKGKLASLESADIGRLRAVIEESEGKIKKLQIAISRKDDIIRESKQHIDRLTESAAALAVSEEAARSDALAQTLRADLVKKSDEMKHLRELVSRYEAGMNQGLASAEQAGKRESEAWHLAGEEAREMHSRTMSLLECTRSLSLIVVRNAAAMRTAAGVSGAGGQGGPAAPVEDGAAGERTHRASVRAASEALGEFVQTLGRRPRADVPERWRRELLTSLVETAHSESEWAETVLANALGFAPSADAWLKESSTEETEPSGGALLADELEYVSQRMAWSLQEGPSVSAEPESPPPSPEI